MLMFFAEYIYRKSFYSLMFALMLSSCMWRNDFGITAKTYNGFTKDNAEKYNYILEEDNITWKDKNGKDVLLTQEDKSTIATKVNQCLMDAGYSTDDEDETTKRIVLNLDFTETETKDAEIYYDREMVKKYKGKYNFDFEPYIGPKNKTFIILKDGDYKYSEYTESFINYSGEDKVYFMGLPNYSKFGGRSPLYCGVCKSKHQVAREDKADLSNFYATLSGKEGDVSKFDITLHYKLNLIKQDTRIRRTRDRLINHFVQYICLFIGDNFNDMQIVPTWGNKANEFGSITKMNLSINFSDYQYLKNRLNNYRQNHYTIINKKNNEQLLKSISISLSGYDGYSDLYSTKLDDVYWFSEGVGSGRHRHNVVYYYLPFYHLKYPISQLEIKNNYHK